MSVGYSNSGKILIILVLALLPELLWSQDQSSPAESMNFHQWYDMSLSLSNSYVSHPSAEARYAIGADWSFYLGRFASINANFAAGRGYFQGGIALFGLPFFLLRNPEGGAFESDGTLSDLLWGLVLAVLTLENINVHIPATRWLEVSPYFSLFRIKYIKEGYGGSGEDTNINLVLGGRLNFYATERIFLAPYVEWTRDWNREGKWGINSGLSLGVYFFNQ
jgi:hypothetical protein